MIKVTTPSTFTEYYIIISHNSYENNCNSYTTKKSSTISSRKQRCYSFLLAAEDCGNYFFKVPRNIHTFILINSKYCFLTFSQSSIKDCSHYYPTDKHWRQIEDKHSCTCGLFVGTASTINKGYWVGNCFPKLKHEGLLTMLVSIT